MKKKNRAAVELGRLGAGHPKHYSEAERKRRADCMRAINERRRIKTQTTATVS